MKIVQINAVYEYSSTGRTTREMHEYLRSKGIDSYVFCANIKDEENNVFQVGGKLDHIIHAILSRLLGLQGYFSHVPTLKILSKLNVINPDIVILRNLHANFINIPIILKYLGKQGIATVVVLHDCYLFTGHCCYYTKDQCEKWKSECNNCPILHKYNSSLFFDWSRKIFRDKKNLFGSIKKLAVIGVSNWVANEARQSPVFSNAFRIERIYNWIDQSVFSPRLNEGIREKYGINKDDFVVLGVAQIWDDVKGLPLFIQLAEKMPDIIVLLAGEIKQRTELPSNLVSAGVISGTDELARLYSMADVLVNFSIQETFGKVAAEALSSGTPIIVNKSTANPELCGDGCGKIVKHRDCSEVMKQVELIRQEGKTQYSKRCRAFALDNFNKEKNMKLYLELFKDLA